jgi:lipoyl(octanoyl) transferase
MEISKRARPEIWVCHLGAVPYRDALAIQERLRARRQADELPDTLLLLEHPPVYTRGRRSGADDLPFGEGFYRAKGIDVVTTDRGGKLTYHGPGQLVGYPIMRIDDVHRYLRTMEDAIIAALDDEGIVARSRHDEGIDYTGVWVDDRKIASIGVHVSRGVTTHGFAVNVHNDLEPFSWVVACGLPDVSMTSIACLSSVPEGAREGAIERTGGGERMPTADIDGTPAVTPAPAETPALSCEPALACFRKRMAYAFSQAYRRRQRLVSPQRLGVDTANASTRAQRVPIKTDQPAGVQRSASAEAVPA